MFPTNRLPRSCRRVAARYLWPFDHGCATFLGRARAPAGPWVEEGQVWPFDPGPNRHPLTSLDLHHFYMVFWCDKVCKGILLQQQHPLHPPLFLHVFTSFYMVWSCVINSSKMWPKWPVGKVVVILYYCYCFFVAIDWSLKAADLRCLHLIKSGQCITLVILVLRFPGSMVSFILPAAVMTLAAWCTIFRLNSSSSSGLTRPNKMSSWESTIRQYDHRKTNTCDTYKINYNQFRPTKTLSMIDSM